MFGFALMSCEQFFGFTFLLFLGLLWSLKKAATSPTGKSAAGSLAQMLIAALFGGNGGPRR